MVKKLANIFLSTLRKIFLVLFSIIFLFSSQSFAAETKPKTAQIKQEFEDPDLKLSIEELRKKYPIDWIGWKCAPNCPGYESYLDDSDASDVVALYSIEELKSAFVNVNFVSEDDATIFVSGLVLTFFEGRSEKYLTTNEKRLKKFVYSRKIIAPFGDVKNCTKVSSYFPRISCDKLSKILTTNH